MSNKSQEEKREYISRENRKTLLFIPNVIWIIALFSISCFCLKFEYNEIASAYFTSVIVYLSRLLINTNGIVKPRYVLHTVTIPLVCTVINYGVGFIVESFLS